MSNSLRSNTVKLGSLWRDKGSNEVTIIIKGNRELFDVNLGLLNWITIRWLSRISNSNSLSNLLIFPLEPTESYKGEVALCRIEGEIHLNCFEKWLVRRCFKFKKVTEKKTTSRSMSIYAKSVIEGIRNSDTDQFSFFLNAQIELHTILLTLGENDSYNYGELHSSKNYFRSLQQEWSDSYHKIFELSVVELNFNNFFFRNSSNIGVRLVSEILTTDSYIGLSSSISNQGYLWFRLNEWWEGNCEKQGKQLHSLETPQRLGLPEGKTYNEAMNSFIGGWESLQKTLIRNKNKLEWEDFGKLFKGLQQHLEYSILCLSKAVLSGNEVAAINFLDHLLRWNANNIGRNNTFGSSLAHQIVLTPILLSESWNFVTDKLKNPSCPQDTFDEQQVFSGILQNYWQDACHILACFLLKWSINANKSEDTLSAELIIRLLLGESKDCSDILEKFKFVDNLDEYLISFVRRHSSSYFDSGSYAENLENLASNIKSCTSIEMVPGRGYTTCGSVMDEIVEADFEIASFLANPKIEVNSNIFETIQKLIDPKMANSLKFILEKIPPKISRNKSEPIFKKYYQRKGNKSMRYTKHLKYGKNQFSKLKKTIDSTNL